MVQTFTVDVATSMPASLTQQEVEDAILHAIFEKNSQIGCSAGAIKVEVEQTFGKIQVGTAMY